MVGVNPNDDPLVAFELDQLVVTVGLIIDNKLEERDAKTLKRKYPNVRAAVEALQRSRPAIRKIKPTNAIPGALLEHRRHV